MAKVSFIGLGVMGYPMAGHLAKKGGHDLTVYNRNATKAAAWVKEYGGGRAAPTPAEAAKDADFVFCCVGNDNDLREVTLGAQGAFGAMKKGAVFIDNTTASANVARDLYAAAKAKGFDFLDAPVSGGQAGAQNGVLTVMVGGDKAAFDRAQPVIANYARMVTLIGPAGAGQLTKMVNQICIAGLVQGLSEGLAFAQKAGLDGEGFVFLVRAGQTPFESERQLGFLGAYQFDVLVFTLHRDEIVGGDGSNRCCPSRHEANDTIAFDRVETIEAGQGLNR